MIVAPIVWLSGPFSSKGVESRARRIDEARGRELARELALARENRDPFVAAYCLRRCIARAERERV